MAAQELEAAEADAQLKKKSGPNNPEAASEFVTNVTMPETSFLILTPNLSPGTMTSCAKMKIISKKLQFKVYWTRLMTQHARCYRWKQSVTNKTRKSVQTPEPVPITF